MAIAVNQMSHQDLLALPAVTDIETAGRAWGFGRSKSRDLARTGDFPCPVLKVGHAYRVRKVELLRSLGLNLDGTPISQPAASPVDPQPAGLTA